MGVRRGRVEWGLKVIKTGVRRSRVIRGKVVRVKRHKVWI